MKNRFLNPDRSCPPVYAVDSTDPDLWTSKCHDPALRILEAVLAGSKPDQTPLKSLDVGPRDYHEDVKRIFKCELCDRSFQGKEQLQAHTKGKRHALMVKQLKKVSSKSPLKSSKVELGLH